MKPIKFNRGLGWNSATSGVFFGLVSLALLAGCSSAPKEHKSTVAPDLKAPFELTGRAPAVWPAWDEKGQMRFHLADWLQNPGDDLVDQAVVQVTRINERVYQVQYSYPRAMVAPDLPPVNTETQGVYHYCVAARLAAIQGKSHWGTAEPFDDEALEEHRSVRLLALALEADTASYRQQLPEHLPSPVESLGTEKARVVCQTHMRKEFLW